MNKFVSYIRVSTKRQGDSGLGLESQQAIINHYYPNIDREFVEIGSAKTVTDRPVLNEAIEYCNTHKATLVVAKVDRLSRDVVDGLTLISKMPGMIKFCDLPGEVDRFTLTLYFAFAEREREIISIRTRNGLNAKRLRGEPMGTNLPELQGKLDSISYKLAGAKAKKDEAISNVSNRQTYGYAIELRNQGYTYSQISKRVNDSKHETSRKGKWSPVTIRRLLLRGE